MINMQVLNYRRRNARNDAQNLCRSTGIDELFSVIEKSIVAVQKDLFSFDIIVSKICFMRRIVVSLFIAQGFITGCGIFHHMPKEGMSVRIHNTGKCTTEGYRVCGHKFKGLTPGEYSEYQLFKALSKEDPVAVFIDSIKVEQATDYKHPAIATRKKITIDVGLNTKERKDYGMCVAYKFE